MAYKQLGPGVSQNPQTIVAGAGAYTAEDHSWEGVVFQFNKPVNDWELNLQNEITSAYGLGQHVRQTVPSGFLSGDFYEYSAVGPDFMFSISPGYENAFMMAASDLVVNGWSVRFEYSDTETNGWNKIQLSGPPSTGRDSELVILEVWRALVTAGSGDNKSVSGQILRHGNAKAPDSVGNRNLVDDLIDPTYLDETQARVQIQYRYRVISWGSIEGTYPEAPDGVMANTVPYLNSSDVDGDSTSYPYERVTGDPGLWRAGDGDSTSASDLGTVDGYVYAIPLCAVYRRNSDGFDRSINLNGGVLIAVGTSDRPDGLFADQIVDKDVKDLRKAATSNFQEALTRNFNYLIQNQLATQSEILSPSNCGGTSVFVHNTLAPSGRQTPDGVRRLFSDRAVTETIVCKKQVMSPYSTVVIGMDDMPIVWYGSSVDLSSLVPSGTKFLEVRKLRLTVNSTQEVDGLDPTNGVIYADVIDLSSDEVTINFTDISASGDVYAYVELAIGYPGDCGLERTPVEDGQVWMPESLDAWIDPAYVEALPDLSRLLLDSSLWSIQWFHRELSLSLLCESESDNVFASSTGDYVMLPNRLSGSVTIDDGINPSYGTTNYTINTTYTKIQLSHTVPANTVVNVTYTQLIPSPPLPAGPGTWYDVFYTARANQSVEVPSGTYQMKLRLRAISPHMLMVTGSSASPDTPDWDLNGISQIPMANGDGEGSVGSSPVGVIMPDSAPVNSGFAYVPSKFTYLKNSEVLLRNVGDTVVDSDGRYFWPRIGVNDVVEFRGIEDMGSDFPHRAVYPALMEVVSTDTNQIRPGTLVLALFTTYGTDSLSSISVLPTSSSGCVSIYRTRGNLINSRRLTQ
jgi:hypothetical protein